MYRRPVSSRSVLSLLCARAERVGGMETYLKSISLQLNRAGWHSIVCFANEPTGLARDFLEHSACLFDIVPIWVEEPWASVRAFARVMRRYRPEIVHFHFLSLITPFPWVALLLGARRIVLTNHISRAENDGWARAGSIKRAIARAITWPLSSVVCPSDFIAESVKALGFVSEEKVIRVYNAVDLGRPTGPGSAMREHLGIPQDAPVILQVSWLIPEKGLEDLIAAAQSVLARSPRARFVIAGDGYKGDEYRALVKASGMEPSFVFTGMVSDPFAEGLFAMADVVVQPSRWQEAFGFSIAEAMAAAKPVVGTATGGIPEVIEDGVSGMLVPVRAPDRLADAIATLLADESLRRRMGTAGLRIVQERFDLEQRVSDILRIYGVEQAEAPPVRRAAATAAGR